MRVVLTAILFAGCASGSTPRNEAQVDAPTGEFLDAEETATDGPSGPIDAPEQHTDAEQHIDAPVDAFVFQDACAPQVTELLTNPVFDLNPIGTGWVEAPIPNAIGGPYPPITADGIAPHSPANKVWLGGMTSSSDDVNPSALSVTDSIYQQVTIPAGTTQLVLTGYFVVGSAETTTVSIYDRASLDLTQTNGTVIENVQTLSNLSEPLTPGGAWTPFSKTFAGNLSGMTVRIRATSTNDISEVTNFFYDTLSLKATHCP